MNLPPTELEDKGRDQKRRKDGHGGLNKDDYIQRTEAP